VNRQSCPLPVHRFMPFGAVRRFQAVMRSATPSRRPDCRSLAGNPYRALAFRRHACPMVSCLGISPRLRTVLSRLLCRDIGASALSPVLWWAQPWQGRLSAYKHERCGSSSYAHHRIGAHARKCRLPTDSHIVLSRPHSGKNFKLIEAVPGCGGDNLRFGKNRVNWPAGDILAAIFGRSQGAI
jgi:hypothetical protein